MAVIPDDVTSAVSRVQIARCQSPDVQTDNQLGALGAEVLAALS